MKFLAAKFLRFSVRRAAPYGEALTPAANAIFFLLASSYKRTKIRRRDEFYSLCPVVFLRATFRSREISCRISEPRATPITAVPLTFPAFPWRKVLRFRRNALAAILLSAITDHKSPPNVRFYSYIVREHLIRNGENRKARLKYIITFQDSWFFIATRKRNIFPLKNNRIVFGEKYIPNVIHPFWEIFYINHEEMYVLQ